jgi:transposase-like protein
LTPILASNLLLTLDNQDGIYELERVNKEIKRRTRVVGIFPNEAACLRLISAHLMEIDEEWQTGKAYVTFEENRVSP